MLCSHKRVSIRKQWSTVSRQLKCVPKWSKIHYCSSRILRRRSISWRIRTPSEEVQLSRNYLRQRKTLRSCVDLPMVQKVGEDKVLKIGKLGIPVVLILRIALLIDQRTQLLSSSGIISNLDITPHWMDLWWIHNFKISQDPTSEKEHILILVTWIRNYPGDQKILNLRNNSLRQAHSRQTQMLSQFTKSGSNPVL